MPELANPARPPLIESRWCGGSVNIVDPARICGQGNICHRATIIDDLSIREAVGSTDGLLAHMQASYSQGRFQFVRSGPEYAPACDYQFVIFPAYPPVGTGRPFAITAGEAARLGVLPEPVYRRLWGSDHWSPEEVARSAAAKKRALEASTLVHTIDQMNRPPAELSRVFDSVRDNVYRPAKKFIEEAADKVLPGLGTLALVVAILGAGVVATTLLVKKQ